MIVVLKQNPNRHQLESLIAWLQEKGIIIHTSIGEAHTILGLVGDTSQLDIDLIAALDIVEDVKILILSNSLISNPKLVL